MKNIDFFKKKIVCYKNQIYFYSAIISIILFLLGALNHTVIPQVFGRQLNLYLPQLQFGYVMFNKVPHVIVTMSYKNNDQQPWQHLEDLVSTSSYGYKKARTWINTLLHPKFNYMFCKIQLKSDNRLIRMQLYVENHLVKEKTINCKDVDKNSFQREYQNLVNEKNI